MSSFLSVSEDSIEANQAGHQTNMYGSIVADDEGNMSLDEIGEDEAEVCAVIFAHYAFKFLSDISYITFCMKVTTVDASINRLKCACKGQCAKRKGRGACKCHEGNKKCQELCSCDKRKCKNKVCSGYFAIISVKLMMQEAPHNSVSLISGKRRRQYR